MTVAGCLCGRWEGFGNRRFRWMSPVVACASVRLALKVKTAREKGVEHKNVTNIYIFRGEERGRAAVCLEQVWNHLEYYTSLGISVCNNTLHFISPKAFLSGRIPSELHCLFCPRVDICHMSKAAPFPEYFTQLSGKQLRLKEDLWQDRMIAYLARVTNVCLISGNFASLYN